MRKNNVIKIDAKGVCIIDGDIDVYQAAVAEAKSTRKIIGMDEELGTASVESLIKGLRKTFERYQRITRCGSYVVMLSGDTNKNWRKRILPSYKESRKKVPKPPLIKPLREALLSDPSIASRQRSNLEGDDLCGIFATAQRGKGVRTVIVSLDKDMKTIPGRIYNPSKHKEGVVKVTDEEALLYHMTQTLTGDSTDNYKGCPGIGPAKAEAALAQGCGSTLEKLSRSYWKIVVDTYKAKGYAEKDAIIQARVACILHAKHWNPKTRRIKLWTPPGKTK